MPVYKKFFCLIFFTVFSISLFAIAPPDSTGVKTVNGKKFILHKVEIKDYWYSVARRYQVNPIALQKANPKIQGDLKIGNIIMVPIAEKAFLMPSIKETTPKATITNPSKEKISEVPASKEVLAAKPVKEAEKPKTEIAVKKEVKPSAAEVKPIVKITPPVVVPVAPKEVKKAVNAIPESKVIVKKEEIKSLPEKKESNELVPVKKVESAKIQPKSNPSLIKSNQNKGKFPIIHSVKPSETIFSISQQYGISLSDLISWNNLVSDELKPGQQMVVGFGSNEQTGNNESTEPKVKESKTVISETKVNVNTKENSNEKTENALASAKEVKPIKSVPQIVKSEAKSDPSAREISERGIASWINDKEINPSKFYALHRSAPVGTIIKVTNTMNNKDVFVKVVGPLPDTGDNNNVIIKISKAAVEKIEAIDQKFQVSLSYGESR